MALPVPVDTTTALVNFLWSHPDWPKSGASKIEVHGIELPDNWSLNRAVVVLPDGVPMNIDLPLVRSRFTIWCYGVTPSDAKNVATTLASVVHRLTVRNVTVDSKTVRVAQGEVVSDGFFFREPDTEWPRFVVVVQVTFSEWSV